LSNFLYVRRAKIQEIDEVGRPLGEPDYGILASDDHEQQFTSAYRSLEELNQAIRQAGNILDVVGGFEMISRAGIGYENFAGQPRGSMIEPDGLAGPNEPG
jgi:hypothetical protein